MKESFLSQEEVDALLEGVAGANADDGDSLEKIARAHGMTLQEIRELNALKSSTIHPGQELTVRQS